jgi:hypothetical protein
MNNQQFLITLALTAAVLLSGCAAQPARPAPAADGAPAEQSLSAPTAAALAEPAQAESRPALPEPCALLTQADLAQVLPESFSEGEASQMPVTEGATFIPKNCAFHSGDKQIVLTIFLASTYQEHKELAAIGEAPQVVGGVGEEAFWDSDSQGLTVLKGQFVVTLGFSFMDASPDIATSLVQQALSRLR